MCNFDPVRTPWGPPGGLCKKKIVFLSMCLRGLIIVLFCRIHGLDVPIPVWFSQDAVGPQKGDIVSNPPHPPPFPLFATEKNCFSTNRMHWNDLKGCLKKYSCFRCHFKVSILTHFGRTLKLKNPNHEV